MAFYALGDLHLSFSSEKPMDIFGSRWENHVEQIGTNWSRVVAPDDVVLLPGDISWAMALDRAAPDLQFIAQLPGRKVMIRGNHDYWWHSIGKVRSILHSSMTAIQNDAVTLDGVTVCGTRGWLLPSHPKFTDEDEKIYQREIERLKLSLKSASASGLPIVAMLHYPPMTDLDHSTPFTKLFEEFGVNVCVYGHLHGNAHRYRVEGVKNGVTYMLVSADFINFQPVPIPVRSS